MTQSVIHLPRVAWDGARAFVQASVGRDYETFASQVLGLLGVEQYTELAETRERVRTAQIRSDGDRRVTDVELGRWRVRIEELLRNRPELIDAVRDLTASAH